MYKFLQAYNIYNNKYKYSNANIESDIYRERTIFLLYYYYYCLFVTYTFICIANGRKTKQIKQEIVEFCFSNK